MVLCCGWTAATGALFIASALATLVWFKIDACTFDVLVIGIWLIDADIHIPSLTLV